MLYSIFYGGRRSLLAGLKGDIIFLKDAAR